MVIISINVVVDTLLGDNIFVCACIVKFLDRATCIKTSVEPLQDKVHYHFTWISNHLFYFCSAYHTCRRTYVVSAEKKDD